ncbi:hypothetical protein KKE99_04055 [Patescibacteria group bacterium]|nr:hypothetical protein [Patescibacteria group bacterium]
MKNNNLQIKSLGKSDLAKLAESKRNGEFALSFYLGLKPEVNFRSEANSILAGEAEKIKKDKEYSKSAKKKILAMMGLIKKEINFLRLPSEARTLVFFLGGKSRIIIYRVPVYIRSRIVVEADYYIYPLASVLENFPNYAAVALERDKFRIFNIFMGKIEGSSDVSESDVPQRINAARADWKGLNETRIQRHIEDHLARHLKKAALAAGDYFLKNKCDYLIIGARKEYTAKFINLLDKRLAKKVAGTWRILPHYHINRIKRKSLEAVNEYNRKMEEKIVKDLLDGIEGKIWAAVAGIGSVLENLYLHKIKMFVIGANCKKPGFVCETCHRISLLPVACLSCGGKTAKASDLADEIIEEAIKNKIKIKQLFHSHKKFDRFGIGAFLKNY